MPRIRHSPIQVLLLGGVLASGLNFGASLFLHSGLGWNPFISFLIGTLLNLCFIISITTPSMRTARSGCARHCRYRPGFTWQWLRGSMGLLWVFLRGLGLSFPLAVACSIGVLSVLSVLVIRVSTFSTAELAEVN